MIERARLAEDYRRAKGDAAANELALMQLLADQPHAQLRLLEQQLRDLAERMKILAGMQRRLKVQAEEIKLQLENK